jgi:hypothetical protein
MLLELIRRNTREDRDGYGWVRYGKESQKTVSKDSGPEETPRVHDESRRTTGIECNCFRCVLSARNVVNFVLPEAPCEPTWREESIVRSFSIKQEFWKGLMKCMYRPVGTTDWNGVFQ